ncbi:ABC transporter permease [Aminobacter sp. MSH1]|uniref:ABC transporter permease n=1 Tax=Aminobacter sp. MSH1 TaxID=374606 RepID=UPI000D344C80|nr:ABC transporter permease [Aminobacter sp. MSH1]
MRYISARVAELIIVFVGLSVLIFVLSRILPGDPVRYALGPGATPQQIQQMTTEMGFDRPIWEQYFILMHGMASGNFGTSLVTHRPIAGDMFTFIPATIELALFALFLSVVLGVGLGMAAAVYRGRWQDQVIRLCAFCAVALPAFWLAILLQQNLSFQAGLLPAFGRLPASMTPPLHITGLYLVDSLMTLDFVRFASSLSHIFLPALVLAASPTAMILRLVRASMVEQMAKDFTVAAEANGMPQGILVTKYVLRNSFSATLTIVGLLVGYFIGNAFLVETVFSWPGIGRFGVRALQFKDFNAIIAVTLFVGLAYGVTNTLVTVLYGWLDPRLRLSR